MNRTKDLIADTFSELLEQKPISKITVKDIVERCGINRNTFYYHFQDIPALCEYIWKQRIDDLIATHCHPDSPSEAVAVAVNFFTEHKASVLHVYKSLPRETFLHYLDDLCMYLVREYMETVLADTPIPEQRIEFLIRYYKCILVGIFLDWLDSNMSYDLLDTALLICDLRSESGREMLERLCNPKPLVVPKVSEL